MTAADAMWAALGGLTTDDPEGVLRHFVEALAAPMAGIEAVIRDGVPWAAALDPDTVPAEALPWLAQFAGVVLDDRLSEGAQRTAIKDRPAARAGTPAAVRAAARPWLSFGDVVVVERWQGSAWRVAVEYFTTQVETASLADVASSHETLGDVAARWRRLDDMSGEEDDLQAAVLDAVPADIVVTFRPLTSRTLLAVSTEYADLAAVAADNPTLADLAATPAP